MSEEKKRVNLLPLCAAFNLLQLYEDGSVAINTSHVEYWTAEDDGSSHVVMASGKVFPLSPGQTSELVNATRRALEQAHKQAARQGSGLIELPGMAAPSRMH